MNEDRFNMDIRKFLKVVGVTSQREIETAVRDALAKGKLAQSALLKPRVTLSIPELGLDTSSMARSALVSRRLAPPRLLRRSAPRNDDICRRHRARSAAISPSLFRGGHHD